MTSQIESGDSARSVQSDEEQAAQSAPHVTPKSVGPFVQYTGPQTGSGSVAQIHPEHWALQGIAAATRSFVWKLQNNWRIPASRFSAEQLDYLLNTSTRFQLVNDKGVKVDS